MRTNLVHWLRLCKAYPNINHADAWHARLIGAYGEPQRAYHTLPHLDECLLACDEARHSGFLCDPDEVELALWLHDAIYDPRRSDNESQSAALALELLGATAQSQRIANLIMLTHGHQPSSGPDDSWMIDIDLAIFSKPMPRVWEYEQQIRCEYAWVEEAAYRVKRRKILVEFATRPRLYLTDFFHTKHEPLAKRNLHALIAVLDADTSPQ
jgi:predicted metal-dependent HD superfamily phosphohydrolase